MRDQLTERLVELELERNIFKSERDSARKLLQVSRDDFSKVSASCDELIGENLTLKVEIDKLKDQKPYANEIADILEKLVDFSPKPYEEEVATITRAEELIDELRLLSPAQKVIR